MDPVADRAQSTSIDGVSYVLVTFHFAPPSIILNTFQLVQLVKEKKITTFDTILPTFPSTYGFCCVCSSVVFLLTPQFLLQNLH